MPVFRYFGNGLKYNMNIIERAVQGEGKLSTGSFQLQIKKEIKHEAYTDKDLFNATGSFENEHFNSKCSLNLVSYFLPKKGGIL